MALVGRLPVKVTEENGAILPGDRLTVSKTVPGAAMKQTEPGQSIGIALERFELGIMNNELGMGKILVFVNLSYWVPSLEQLTIDDDLVAKPLSNPTNGLFAYILNQFKKIGVVMERGVVRVVSLFADKVTTKELCLDDVCVTKEQLKTLLERSGIQVQITNDRASISNQSPITNDQTITNDESTSTASSSSEPVLENITNPTPTPEPAPENTPEPTLTLTSEPSLLITPGSTPEATIESTPELTPEPTPELTPEPTPAQEVE